MAIVAGCQATGSGSDATRETPANAAAQLIDQDVEAPQIYDVTERALWDGRPSLGGIWVAAPDVNQPERVIMRNPQTGKSVVGALFKREHGNPGPRLQLSSDAAEALGIFAGSPTEISVVALRRKDVPDEVNPALAEKPAPRDPEAETPVADAEASAATLEDDAIAAATAAVEALEETDTGADGTDVAATAPDAPRQRGFFGRLFRGNGQGRQAEETVTPDLPDVPVDAAADAATEVVEGAAEAATAAAPTVLPAPRPEPVLETTTDAPEATLAAPEAETKPRGGGFFGRLFRGDSRHGASAAQDTQAEAAPGAPEPLPSGAAAPEVTATTLDDTATTETASAAPANTNSSGLDKPIVQIGRFTDRASADAAAQAMSRAGVLSSIERRTNARGTTWRVFVGPMTTRRDQTAILRKARDLGYEDAVAVES